MNSNCKPLVRVRLNSFFGFDTEKGKLFYQSFALQEVHQTFNGKKWGKELKKIKENETLSGSLRKMSFPDRLG